MGISSLVFNVTYDIQVGSWTFKLEQHSCSRLSLAATKSKWSLQCQGLQAQAVSEPEPGLQAGSARAEKRSRRLGLAGPGPPAAARGHAGAKSSRTQVNGRNSDSTGRSGTRAGAGISFMPVTVWQCRTSNHYSTHCLRLRNSTCHVEVTVPVTHWDALTPARVSRAGPGIMM